MLDSNSAGCPSEARIADFIEGRLEADELERFERHVDACPSCRELLVDLARAATRPEVDADEAALPKVGDTVGRYRLDARLGAGGMGVVFEAYDAELDRRVALKFLHGLGEGPTRPTDGERERLRLEAIAMARLQHPSIAAVYDVGEAAGRSFVAMELLVGGTLRRWQESGELGWEAIVGQYVAAGRGLVAAHEGGLVHRDFKPDNVLLDAGGRPKIVDFGIARAVRPSSDPTSSTELLELRTVGPSGTPAYMSPEQYAGGAVDPRSDQFSFAVALFEALYGRRPYPGKTVQQLVASIAEGTIVPPTPGIPDRIYRALSRALATDPDARYSSVAELLDELERQPWALARSLAPWLGAAALVAGIGYAGWALTRPAQVTVAVTAEGQPLPPTRVLVGDEALTVEGTVAHGEVPPGAWVVRVEANGFEPATTAIQAQRAGTHHLTLDLEPQTGLLDLEVEPAGAAIRIDGEDYGSRLRNLPLRVGSHTIDVAHDGHHGLSTTWTIDADVHRRERVTLPRSVRWDQMLDGVAPSANWLDSARPMVVTRSTNTIALFDPWAGSARWSLVASDSDPAHVELCSGDLDGDDEDDVVLLRDRDGRVELVRLASDRGDDGRPTITWRVDLGPRSPSIPARMAAPRCPDIDGDGRADLVVSLPDTGELVRLDSEGQTVWRVPTRAPAWEVAVSDALLVRTSKTVNAHEPDSGAIRWSSALTDDAEPSPTLARVRSSAREGLASVLGSASLDTIDGLDVLAQRAVANGRIEVVALAGASGEVLWRRTVDAPTPLGFDALRRDLDGDGREAILLGAGRWPYDTSPGLVVDSTGEILWRDDVGAIGRGFVDWPPQSTSVYALRDDVVELRDARTGELRATLRRDGARPTARPVVADFAGEGRHDLVVAWSDGAITSHDSAAKARAIAHAPRPIRDFGAPRDIDADGHIDLLAEATGPTLLTAPDQCWSRPGSRAIRATPVVKDLDGDGSLDVLVFGELGAGHGLYRLDASTGRILEKNTTSGFILMNAPTLVPDDDGAGFDLVFAAHGVKSLARVDGETLRPETAVDIPETYAPVTVLDDGSVIVAAWSDERFGLARMRLDDPSPDWTTPPSSGVRYAPLVVGSQVIAAFEDGTTSAIDLQTGSERWTRNLGSPNLGGMAILHHDGSPLVLTIGRVGDRWDVVGQDPVSGDEALRLLDVAGPTTVPRVFEGDVFVQDSQNRVVRVGPDGTVRWRGEPGPFAPALGLGGGPLAVFDLDHDGGAEAWAAFPDGRVAAYDVATGTRLWRSFESAHAIEATPVPVDVDGDGHDELLVASRDGAIRCHRVAFTRERRLPAADPARSPRSASPPRTSAPRNPR